MKATPKPHAPRPGQVSVWSFPRPPLVEPEPQHLAIEFGATIASTNRGVRVLETSHPPVYFFPAEDVSRGVLQATGRRSFCEWKGEAIYFDVKSPDGRVAHGAAFAYPKPTALFAAYANWVSFYAAPFDRCLVGDEVVTPQPGNFYSGWISSGYAGPFKGTPGSEGW